jgi:acyl-CoA synthetase (NDP forming)
MSIKKSDCKILKRIFEPGAVAVIGVSAEGFGFGRGILLSLKRIGFNGALYPVNPRGGTIDGLPAYRTVEEIPGPIDLGIIAVPATHVPAAIEACFRKGAAGVEILSSGFSETATQEGITLERDVARIASKGIRVIGPNCFGVYNPRSGLTLLPGPDLSREPGPVAFISQSGGMTVDFAHIGKWRGIRFSTMISFGNGVDLRETELLDYFGSDPDTGVIGLYVEGLEDGRSFFNALGSVSSRKPVILCKGGRTESGGKAAMSHTASVAGSTEVWNAVMRQCNAVPAADLGQLCDIALAFTSLPQGVYRGASIIGGGGAIGVAAADAASLLGIKIPEFSEDLKAAIEPHLPRPGSSAKNPVDVANPYVSPASMKEILISAARCQEVDVQIVVQLLYHYKSLSMLMPGATLEKVTPVNEFAAVFRQVVEESGKPVVVVLPEHKQELEALDIATVTRTARALYAEKGIPVYGSVEQALGAIRSVSDYYGRRRSRISPKQR